MIEVIEGELTDVRWMAQHGSTSERKAAASLRVLTLEKEIEELRKAG
jgi:hypothetical protein